MDQEHNVGGKSNKGIYIVIAVIVIILIGWFIKKSMYSMAGVDVNRNFDGSATYSNDQGSVTVGGNKLPGNWPSDAPQYPNANIQYSGTSNPQTGEEGAAVVFTTSDKVQSVSDFYTKALVSNGWRVEQTANVGANTVISATKDKRTFGAYIADNGNGQIVVTVGIGLSK